MNDHSTRLSVAKRAITARSLLPVGSRRGKGNERLSVHCDIAKERAVLGTDTRIKSSCGVLAVTGVRHGNTMSVKRIAMARMWQERRRPNSTRARRAKRKERERKKERSHPRQETKRGIKKERTMHCRNEKALWACMMQEPPAASPHQWNV